MTDVRTVNAALEQLAEWRPNHTAFIQAETGRRETFIEVNEIAQSLANALSDNGVGKGDVVTLLSRTTVEHALSYFAVQKVGAIPATLHNREAPNKIVFLVDQVGAKGLFFQPQFADTAEAISDHIGLDLIVEYDRDGTAEISGFGTPLSTLLDEGSSRSVGVDVNPSDPAFINFSSGTTGEPKGIVHTHEEAIECAHAGQFIFSPHSDDTILNSFTPSFIGWQNMTLPIVNAGGKSVMVEEWNPQLVLQMVEDEAVTIFLLVPTQWKMLLDADINQYDLSSVRLGGYAGETMGEDLFRRLREDVTENFFTVYGTTETMDCGIALLPHEVTEETLASVGKPVPNTEVRIVEPDSHDPLAPVEQGEAGELILRGPSIAEEVWDDPVTTDEIFHEEGWWFSGDLARVGDDGNVYIEGRTDNMIISGGLNIYAEGVEGTIEAHPSVVECAVIGVPHDQWNEAVKAFVVTRDDVTVGDLDEWCKNNDNLGNYQRPREWEFVDELPRTNTGKLNRSVLREREDGSS